jgi:spermidine synthase
MRLLLGLLFLASGFAGLLHEMLWIRASSFIVGNTTQAMAAVLAGYMGGLALGNAAAGRWAGRSRRALALYGWLELGIALLAWLAFVGLRAGRERMDAGTGWVLLCIVPPTALMGATLAVLLRTEEGRENPATAWYYGLNTVGAALGAFVSGFFLMRLWGMQATALCAVGLNAAVGLLALGLERRGPGQAPARARINAPFRPGDAALLAVFFLSGAACFGYELVQSRLLGYLVGNRIFAAALILSVFLAAMGLGSLLHHALPKRLHGAGLFAWCQIGIGLSMTVLLAEYPGLLAWAQALEPRFVARGTWALVGFKAALAAACLFAPAFFMGIAFPALLDQLSRGRALTQAVGRAVAWNTTGCIAGSLCVGFWLIPRVDTWNAGLLLSLLSLGLGHRWLAPSWGGLPAWRRALSVGACVGVALSLSAYAWGRREWPLQRPGMELLTQHEDSTALFSLWRGPLGFYLFGDSTPLSFPEGPSSRAEQVQRFQAVLPLLLHPQAKNAVVVGLGFGTTVGALAASGALEQVDAVELFPSLVPAIGGLPQFNEDVLHQPRARIHVGDGRHFLMDKAGAYDIVATNLTDADMPGSAACYTREYMALAHRALKPGGLFLIHTYGPQREVLLKTVSAEFPWAEAYQAYKYSLFILAADKAPRWDARAIDRRLAKEPLLRVQARRAGLRSAKDLQARLNLNPRELRALVAKDPATPLNTDDRPLMEYHMGKADQLFKADLQ